MTLKLNAGVPDAPIEEMWERHQFEMKLVNPANKRKHTVIVVGSGLAGASAAATMSELGYHVKCFCFQDSPRRAHSIAAQGGINAAKNYQNDGDSVYRPTSACAVGSPLCTRRLWPRATTRPCSSASTEPMGSPPSASPAFASASASRKSSCSRISLPSFSIRALIPECPTQALFA